MNCQTHLNHLIRIIPLIAIVLSAPPVFGEAPSACVVPLEKMSDALQKPVTKTVEAKTAFGLPVCEYHDSTGLLAQVATQAPGGQEPFNRTVEAFVARMRQERRSEATRDVGTQSFNAFNGIQVVAGGRVLGVQVQLRTGMSFGAKVRAAKAVAEALNQTTTSH